MTRKWNLTDAQWADVLLSGSPMEGVARRLLKGEWLPWVEILLRCTHESDSTLDLGSGRGEHSAALALRGRNTTLLDWSKDNIECSARLYEAIGRRGTFCHADMTQPLPFETGSFDMVFSCGVFEYFPAETIRKIVAEALRASRKRVIIMVPNALSLPYRLGMWHMKRTEQWPWGGEVPSYTLKHYFRSASNLRVSEFSVGARQSLDFLTMPGGETIKKVCTRLLNLRHHSKPALFRQGYLLITVAEKLS